MALEGVGKALMGARLYSPWFFGELPGENWLLLG